MAMVAGRDIKSKRDSLVTFLSETLKLYPSLEEGLEKLIEPSSAKLASLITHSTDSKVFSFQVMQRGKKFIVTRGSTIRNTHGYETFSYHLVSDDTPTNVENNPLLEIELILRSLEPKILSKPH